MREPLLPAQLGEITGSVDPEQDEDIDGDSELPNPDPSTQPAPEEQPEGLPYGDGSLVDAHNAAEVNAYKAHVATLGQPQASRQALRAWFAAQPKEAKGSTNS